MEYASQCKLESGAFAFTGYALHKKARGRSVTCEHDPKTSHFLITLLVAIKCEISLAAFCKRGHIYTAYFPYNVRSAPIHFCTGAIMKKFIYVCKGKNI